MRHGQDQEHRSSDIKRTANGNRRSCADQTKPSSPSPASGTTTSIQLAWHRLPRHHRARPSPACRRRDSEPAPTSRAPRAGSAAFSDDRNLNPRRFANGMTATPPRPTCAARIVVPISDNSMNSTRRGRPALPGQTGRQCEATGSRSHKAAYRSAGRSTAWYSIL